MDHPDAQDVQLHRELLHHVAHHELHQQICRTQWDTRTKARRLLGYLAMLTPAAATPPADPLSASGAALEAGADAP